MASEEELIEARRANASALREAGTQAYPNDFRAHDDETTSRARAVAILTDPEKRAALPEEKDLTGTEPSHHLFGRVVGKRGPFVVIRTPHGDAQALVRNKPGKGGEPALPPQDAKQLELLDLADHVAVQGPMIRTRTGDGAIRADRFQHVGKALLPPPDKWHGLTDVEKRYRERYVDLFANPAVARVFHARSRIVRALRSFLDGRDFLEVETPLLHPLRGGAVAKPFETHHNELDMKLYLRIAPELYLKRLLVGGFDRVYEIGRAFRNEGVSTRHNPEFTILEFYCAYATYEDLMDLTEAMFRHVDAALRTEMHARAPEWWSERAYTLDEPFARVDMREAIVARTRRSSTPQGSGGDLLPTPFDGALTRELLDDPTELHATIERVLHLPKDSHEAAVARLGGADRVQYWREARKLLAKSHTHGERVFVLYEVLVEPDLPKLYRSQDGTKSVPVFVMHHPFDVSPLARKSDRDPFITDRFELFVEGREVANAFSELNDPDDQASRFRAQLDRRTKGDEEAMDYDADYVRALSHGMPPAGGFGLGVDRLVMMLCGQASIRDVLLFPAMRPETPERG
ncbi:lysine--tRNA ligase [Sandaracinus amylolyticus]|uniref:Lysine--tRNA ligase n=1 Tax=Sandaracinus amylolyticus TaxID=927083 RepID=A0A0F6YJX1_9BACT|nr:amino acid--tRNA ligase-related protein [Sandaracinus amylolyticus]AKF08257.1 Lysyl-tRNA synthetase (class II) [Sandaracinus amylolyticus]